MSYRYKGILNQGARKMQVQSRIGTELLKKCLQEQMFFGVKTIEQSLLEKKRVHENVLPTC